MAYAYEEGTFTPTIIGQTTAGTATYNYQIGRYKRIQNMVWVYIHMRWSGHTGTGNAQIESLPYAPNNTSEYVQELHIMPPRATTLSFSNVWPSAHIFANQTYIRPGSWNSDTTGSWNGQTVWAAGEIIVMGWYEAA